MRIRTPEIKTYEQADRWLGARNYKKLPYHTVKPQLDLFGGNDNG